MKPGHHADEILVRHMLDCIACIGEYTQEGQAAFLSSRLIQDAVMVICRHLPNPFSDWVIQLAAECWVRLTNRAVFGSNTSAWVAEQMKQPSCCFPYQPICLCTTGICYRVNLPVTMWNHLEKRHASL